MKDDSLVNTAFTIPNGLMKEALAVAERRHGRRGFSRYLRELITKDVKRSRPKVPAEAS